MSPTSVLIKISKWLYNYLPDRHSHIFDYVYRGVTDGNRNRIRLMVFGDSNAYRPGNNRYCWPAILQRLGGVQIKVDNESYTGRTTQFDLGSLNGLQSIQEKIHRCDRLDYILIALGTNDLKNRYGPPDAIDIVAGIDKIITTINCYNNVTKPVVLTPPPIGCVTSGELAGAQKRVSLLVDEYHRYARSHHVPIIDLFTKIDHNIDLELDRIHLNQVGRKKTAKIVWKHLSSILTKQGHPQPIQFTP